MTKNSNDQLPSSLMPKKPPVLSEYSKLARKQVETLRRLNEVRSKLATMQNRSA